MGRTGIVALGVAAAVAAGCSSHRAVGLPSPSVERVRADMARRAQLDAGVGDPDPNAAGALESLLAAPLDTETAVKVALLANGTVRQAYERLGIARADLLQAGLLRNPVFSFSSKLFSAGPEVELGLAQSFLELFFVPLRRRVARAELCAEEAAVARDLVRLVYDVRRGYVAVHASEAVVRLGEQALARAEAARDLMLRLHAAGNALDTVRTVEELGAARARLDLDAARLEAQEARASFQVLLGLPSARSSWTLAGTLAEPPPGVALDDAVRRARESSLDLIESRARIEAAAAQAGLTSREGRWPGLDLGLVAKRESADGAWGLGPGLSTALPLFDAGQARTLAAQSTLRTRMAHHAQLVVEVESAARRLAARHAALEQRARYLRDVYLPLRERLVAEGLQFFNAMQIGAFEVLHAKQQQLDAVREHAETLREAWIARLDLAELLAGSLNPTRLDTPALPAEAAHAQAPKGH